MTLCRCNRCSRIVPCMHQVVWFEALPRGTTQPGHSNNTRCKNARVYRIHGVPQESCCVPPATLLEQCTARLAKCSAAGTACLLAITIRPLSAQPVHSSTPCCRRTSSTPPAWPPLTMSCHRCLSACVHQCFVPPGAHPGQPAGHWSPAAATHTVCRPGVHWHEPHGGDYRL